VFTFVYCKNDCYYKILRRGSKKRAPNPELGSNMFTNLGLNSPYDLVKRPYKLIKSNPIFGKVFEVLKRGIKFGVPCGPGPLLDFVISVRGQALAFLNLQGSSFQKMHSICKTKHFLILFFQNLERKVSFFASHAVITLSPLSLRPAVLNLGYAYP
jgi:hypothetical protein